jgi:hypothetical protein
MCLKYGILDYDTAQSGPVDVINIVVESATAISKYA